MDASLYGMSSMELSERLFKEVKVAATPMVGWGEKASKYVRFVFSNEPKERLRGVGEKVRRVLKG
jgi:N-succinyldiaminopimelate aminotransferase